MKISAWLLRNTPVFHTGAPPTWTLGRPAFLAQPSCFFVLLYSVKWVLIWALSPTVFSFSPLGGLGIAVNSFITAVTLAFLPTCLSHAVLGEEQVGRHGTLGLSCLLWLGLGISHSSSFRWAARASVFWRSSFNAQGLLGFSRAVGSGSHLVAGILGACADLRVLSSEKVVADWDAWATWVLPLRACVGIRVKVRMSARGDWLRLVQLKSEVVFVGFATPQELTKHSRP